MGHKIYAVYSGAAPEPATLVFKCSSESFEVLTKIDGIVQAPYFARGQWLRVSRTAEVAEEEVRQRIVFSYQLAKNSLTKKQRAELGLTA